MLYVINLLSLLANLVVSVDKEVLRVDTRSSKIRLHCANSVKVFGFHLLKRYDMLTQQLFYGNIFGCHIRNQHTDNRSRFG